MEEMPATLTIEQASEVLGVSIRSGYRAAHRGQIPIMRIGRRLFVPTRPFFEMLGVDLEDGAAVLAGEREPLSA